MASQVKYKDFTSPEDLASYLSSAEQFQLDPLCRTYVDFTRELRKELQNLGAITELFTVVMNQSKNFFCHTTIKQLLTQYHTALTETAKASKKFLDVSTEVVNGYNDVLQTKEQAALQRLKQSADKAIDLFAPIIRPEAQVSASEALGSTITARNPSLEMLKTFEECQKTGGVPDKTVLDAQERALDNIATLDQATKTLGKISTILGNSRLFWASVHLNAGFVASRNSEIGAYMECDLPEEITKISQDASDRWLAIARINQLVLNEIQPVLTALGKLIAPAEEKPSEGKA